jgi:sterol desaturase/sphingolipid hydroxylase (fatty acid hydroxylase superfamily)
LLVVLQRSGRLTWSPSASQRSLLTDLGYFLLAPFTDFFSRTFTTLGIAACALIIGNHVGLELLDGFGPVVQQPRWLVMSEMLVLSDFIYYWTHRLAHTVPFLWRFHAVHHSTQHLRWTSALRAHPAEIYVHFVNMLPLFLLGFPIDALAPLAPIVTLYAFLIHCDANVALRRISYFVNTPMFHGWHHARVVKGSGTNFAGFFPIFDAMFGTYQLPEARPVEVGMDDAQMPETCLAQLRYSLQPRSPRRLLPPTAALISRTCAQDAPSVAASGHASKQLA